VGQQVGGARGEGEGERKRVGQQVVGAPHTQHMIKCVDDRQAVAAAAAAVAAAKRKVKHRRRREGKRYKAVTRLSRSQ